MFMHKPSKRDYPDYYDVISKPMDMTLIRQKMREDEYQSADALVDDVKLMFNNCKTYNVEGSDIYNNAITLETVLLKKYNDLKKKILQNNTRLNENEVHSSETSHGCKVSVNYPEIPSKTFIPFTSINIKSPIKPLETNKRFQRKKL